MHHGITEFFSPSRNPIFCADIIAYRFPSMRLLSPKPHCLIPRRLFCRVIYTVAVLHHGGVHPLNKCQWAFGICSWGRHYRCSLPTGSAGPDHHAGDSCSFCSHKSDKFMNLDHAVVRSGPAQKERQARSTQSWNMWGMRACPEGILGDQMSP